LVSYRAVLARPGARRLALACALGWLSFAAYGLAVVLAVREATGSFATAGGAMAAFSAGSSLLAPARGRLVDRRGVRVVAALAVAHGLAMALLAAGCVAAWPSGALIGAAALAGACVPPFIATARALWPTVAGDDLTRAGHALNAALGDAGQVAGPALVGGVAALAASGATALALLIPGVAVGAMMLVSVGKGAPVAPAVPRDAAPRRPLLAAHPGLRAIVLVELLLGVAFGALDVAAPAVADRAGDAALGALPLTAFALGSVIASLWSGSGGRAARPPAARYRAGCVILALALAPTLAVDGLAALSLLLVGAGAGYGVLNVAVFELLEEVVPTTRAVEAFTWLTTFAGAGMAVGAAIAGGPADDALVLLAGAAVAAALAALWQRVEA
jgi:MFS family permease